MNWKEFAKKFCEKLTPEEVEGFINSNETLEIFKAAKVRNCQRAENEAMRVLNEYYTNELRSALKNINQ